MDLLLQRYLANRDNEAHRNSGVWEDLTLLTVDTTGMTQTQAKDAARAAVRDYLQTLEPLRGMEPDRIRVAKVDQVFEFAATLGKPDLSDQPVVLRGTGAP